MVRGLTLTYHWRSEPLLCFIGVVRSAPELEVPGITGSAVGERHDMVQLQEPTLGAPALGPDEGALAAIPFSIIRANSTQLAAILFRYAAPALADAADGAAGRDGER